MSLRNPMNLTDGEHPGNVQQADYRVPAIDANVWARPALIWPTAWLDYLLAHPGTDPFKIPNDFPG